MAMEQYFQGAVTRSESNEDKPSLDKWKSVSDAADESENMSTGGFDCNICLDSVQDPVITLCGHLYCWPCLYKWIHFQNDSTDNIDRQLPQCPVCKAEISEKTLVPLYGRGQTTKLASESKVPYLGMTIPRRPPSPRCAHPLMTTTTAMHPTQHHSYSPHPQSYHPYIGNNASMSTSSLGGSSMTNMPHPMIGMFGEMVYARVFGNMQTTLYTYPNSYQMGGISNPRVRRQVMEADKSLGRICFFLFCCTVLCLLLF